MKVKGGPTADPREETAVGRENEYQREGEERENNKYKRERERRISTREIKKE